MTRKQEDALYAACMKEVRHPPSQDELASYLRDHPEYNGDANKHPTGHGHMTKPAQKKTLRREAVGSHR